MYIEWKYNNLRLNKLTPFGIVIGIINIMEDESKYCHSTFMKLFEQITQTIRNVTVSRFDVNT